MGTGGRGTRPFRFAVQLAQAASHREWVAQVKLAERLGYSVCVMPDHVSNQLAPLPALVAAADATQRIRIGSLVLDNDFRHPLLLAHEAATVDLLSDGRLELGIGAGWLGRDYERLGIPFAPPRTRLERLRESIQIIESYFAGETFSFEGAHCTAHGVEPGPRWVQQPRPPILIAGGGRRLLRFAARHADIISVFPQSLPGGSGFEVAETSPAAFDAKVALIHSAAGERAAEVELNVLLQDLTLTKNRRSVAVEHAEELGISGEEVLESPLELIGTIEQVVDDLLSRRERYRISYLTIPDRYMQAFAPIVERLSGT